MHVEILVEEPSAEAALRILVPRIIAPEHTFEIYPHQGKDDLLRKLPSRLRGYSNLLRYDADMRVVVLIDADQQNCRYLKQQLEAAASKVGLRTRADAGHPDRIRVVNRIAIEELEAWFFGDVPALVKAFPGIPSTLDQKQEYRDPDAIKGGTWEALERVLQEARYQQGGLTKIATARSIAYHMDPSNNRSRSFNAFRTALIDLTSSEV